VRGNPGPAYDGTRLAPVTVTADAAVICATRSASLRGAAAADALAILGPDWSDGDLAALIDLP
jgi:hypothetical protein